MVTTHTKRFSFYLGNGTLDPSILSPDNDYRPHIIEYGSELEHIYTIFLRNLQIDNHGKVHNVAYAQRRAAQWIRHYLDPQYRVEPPFNNDELELGSP